MTPIIPAPPQSSRRHRFTGHARRALRLLLAAVMVWTGFLHFAHPAPFVQIVPSYLPEHLALVQLSGFFEILGGAGLLIAFARRYAAIGLIALYIAVFPANLSMAMHDTPINGHHFTSMQLWLRLPLQLVLIAWAWWVRRD